MEDERGKRNGFYKGIIFSIPVFLKELVFSR
jgi:hypothetical protein